MSANVVGQWGSLFDLKNVAVHASLLPTGKILYWGRRSNPKDTNPASLNEHFTKAFLLDPSTGESKATATQPKSFGSTAEGVNVFCSGHSLQPDGTLLVVGGHLFDGQGVNQASVYNPQADTWSAKPPMNDGRWYPSALTLPDGSVLSISGSFLFRNETGQTSNVTNINPQILRSNSWVPMPSPPNNVLLLFPRLHLDPSGRVFMAGPQEQSQFLDVNAAGGVGTWTTNGPKRSAGAREYAPSVMYESGKVMYIGGGNNPDGKPTKVTEFIDLNAAKPEWTTSASTDMQFARRQHNATVLPDGTVLVTGGTQGAGFNSLDVGMPVRRAELWNPSTKTWIQMAEESADRCYHAIALLLPDGQVLSAGGGEYSPNNDGNPNAVKDSLTNAQLFKPPYLFKGARPTISSAPSEINYGQKFEITTGTSDLIARVSWVRLGSVTHSCNMNQSLMFLNFQQQSSKVIVQAPANSNLAPPGHYMVFLLSQQGVPSIAPIIRIGVVPAPAIPKPAAVFAQRRATPNHVSTSLPALNDKIISEQTRSAVVVGLTPICPYGLGPCWGGAFDALQKINDVDIVRPIPDQAYSIAFVYLQQDILPDIDVWRKEFQNTANGAYIMRGIEMTVSGLVTKRNSGAGEQLTLAATSTRPELALAPFQASSIIEWDMKAQAPRSMSDAEASAYAQLSAALENHAVGVTIQATGRLQKHGANKFSLDVRNFEVMNGTTAS
ncbi:copper radical oxidase [Polychaeton citri CBS 116435]|uniref:Copper radical oxidase n=1 Tax=Polychaeton citri CBS 116435 TaxID=1314669 RepID=A0A9P4Q7V0_9PEZI|nr:copper radical oxidase [Polychaeton citri CBS 116435]